MKEAVCSVYYTRYETNLTGLDLHQYQKTLAYDMLRQGFSDFLCVKFDESKIQYSVNGKPYYTEKTDCYFNLTHCKDAVAVAVSRIPVGIDAESMRRVRHLSAKKCLSLKEQQYVFENTKLNKLNRDLTKEETARFLQLWTLKESYVKMTGEGIKMPLNQISFPPEEFSIQGNIRFCPKEHNVNSQSFLYIRKDLTLALTVQKDTVLSPSSILWNEIFQKSDAAIQPHCNDA